MACCYGCVKYTLFVINLIITVVGGLIIAFGAYAYIELQTIDLSININATDIESIINGTDIPDVVQTVDDYKILGLNFGSKDTTINNTQIQGIHVDGADILGFKLEYIGIAIIVIGCIIFCISFCGCCGSICRNKCLLGTYTLMMILLAAAHVYLCIAIYDLLVNNILELFDEGFENQEEFLTAAESVFHCCGTFGPDYYNDTNILPPTCCSTPLIETCSIEEDLVYSGCSDVIRDFLNNFVGPSRVVLLIAIGCELITAAMAIYLMCATEKKRVPEQPGIVINYNMARYR